ncbi:hypothetical protein B9Z55_006084 [Caenorhabditis nigoni]|uniref:SPK domain-containing protein n=1 Tax=Caenorhabditis nigoni TaxID=1611254 RepID=A0A2G5V423_9PELO|nr:hypothetical protein B9Z55_006084 [Caenorhabditis nigoni]
MQDAFSRAIQFIYKNVENYSKPEDLFRWCQLAKQPKALQEGIKQRLKKIEELNEYTTLEKVKLVFLFSIPISAKFLKELEDGGCLVKLNTRNVIALFRSSDKTFVLEPTHATNNRNFKGKKEFDDSEIGQNPPQGRPDLPEMDNEGNSLQMGSNDTEPPQKRLKMEQERVRGTNLEMEEVLEEVEWIGREDLILEENTQEQTPGTISLLKLSEHVEILSKKIGLNEKFQQKAEKAVRLCKANDQTMSIHEFNVHFASMMTSLKRSASRNSTENSMKMAKVVKEFQSNLVAPFGRRLVEAVRIPDDNVTIREGREEMIILKTVASKLDGFMNSMSNGWADLD